MQPLTGLSTLSNNFDAILLDLWGCVHDGTALYPQAKECLHAMHKAGKRVMFLSNAPRRASQAQVVLDRLGVPEEWYEAIVTSGEVAFLLMQTRKLAPYDAMKGYYYIGPDKDADVLAGLGQHAVPMEQAEYVLNVGFGTEAQTAEDFTPALQAAQARNLPMLCLNPDMEVVKISGERYPCAGVLAAAYTGLGGTVDYIGKPWPHAYTHCLDKLGLPKARVLAVGDGLLTDIKGARDAGLANVLITGGLLKETADAGAYCAGLGVVPDYLLNELRW